MYRQHERGHDEQERHDEDHYSDQRQPAHAARSANSTYALLLDLLNFFGMLAMLLPARIEGAAPQQELLYHLVFGQRWGLGIVLMLQLYQPRKKLLCISPGHRLKLFVPPDEGAILKFRYLAGGKDARRLMLLLSPLLHHNWMCSAMPSFAVAQDPMRACGSFAVAQDDMAALRTTLNICRLAPGKAERVGDT